MSQPSVVVGSSQRPFPSREVYLQLSGSISEYTIRSLLAIVNQHYTTGVMDYTLLLSSRGGTTQYGHTAYHQLKALPINLTTWNIGVVGSAALSVYCAGKRRYCVAEAKFWLHCTDWTFQGRVYDLTELRPILAEMGHDLQVNAQILAANTNQSVKSLTKQMCAKANWTPEEAVQHGLTHEVTAPTVKAPLIIIQDGMPMGMQVMPMMMPAGPVRPTP